MSSRKELIATVLGVSASVALVALTQFKDVDRFIGDVFAQREAFLVNVQMDSSQLQGWMEEEFV